jgi:hypothetical protein
MSSCRCLQTYRMNERFPFPELPSILKMAAPRYPKKSVNFYQTTRRHIPATFGLSFIAYKRLQHLFTSSSSQNRFIRVLMLTSSMLRRNLPGTGTFRSFIKHEYDHKCFIFSAIMGTPTLEGILVHLRGHTCTSSLTIISTEKS